MVNLIVMMNARRLLQLVLVVQALAALAIAWGVLALGGAGWMGLLVGLGSVVVVRLAINLNNFRMAARAASVTPDEHRLDRRGALRLFTEEFRASMLVTHWCMPRGRAALRVHPGSAYPPVLLVHGYGCNSGYWAQLIPLLDGAAISHAGVDLEPVAAGIDDYAPLIEERVNALLAATGARQVALVAHSMGGLAVRAWMRRYGSARVARLVTLGSPHHGTALADLGPGKNAAQMRRGAAGEGSDWLRALGADETAATRALVTSIYTHHDNIVAPQTSSVLPGARNIAFGGIGHVALGSNPRVLAQVLQELRALHT
jgi:triacylglycerol esterase/lipase EstA (alpha/beta hydrolase family)